MDSRHVLRTIPGITGVWSLITAVFILILLFGPFDVSDYANAGLVISSICSVGFAAGAAIYRQRSRRVALGFVAGMVGWATVFLGLSTMNRGILGSSLISLVPAGLMLLGAWYFGPDTRRVHKLDR
ncbi:hypothetical protein [Halalkalirubrum salinum]|uniref:hypothetical protein n=1 Tax=Halalkalirubrum salinum TaxID=2563889 RepID=UPI0010FB3E7C|nr:hypothetical protein [Halalkalirubrum salinum]